MQEYSPCFACGAKSLNIPGVTHRYMLSSPGCWAMFGEVMEREYTDLRYARAHHYSVDCYACQHPGLSEVSQAVRSVGIHLASLYMLLERGLPLKDAPVFRDAFSQYDRKYPFIHWLQPPADMGPVTIYDVWSLEDPDAHFDKCREWAESTWSAWSAHHEVVKEWVHAFLKAEGQKLPPIR